MSASLRSDGFSSSRCQPSLAATAARTRPLSAKAVLDGANTRRRRSNGSNTPRCTSRAASADRVPAASSCITTALRYVNGSARFKNANTSAWASSLRKPSMKMFVSSVYFTLWGAGARAHPRCHRCGEQRRTLSRALHGMRRSRAPGRLPQSRYRHPTHVERRRAFADPSRRSCEPNLFVCPKGGVGDGPSSALSRWLWPCALRLYERYHTSVWPHGFAATAGNPGILSGSAGALARKRKYPRRIPRARS